MKTKNWFELWFDSPYYHILYANRNYEEAHHFIDNLMENLEMDFGNVLDLACGKGRHAYYLAQKGFEVVGVDIAKNSIDFANTMYQKENLEFYTHDMRLPFRLNYFNYIFNFFTSIGYFDSLKENEKVFKSAFKNLQSNGLFLIDFMNTEKVIANLVEREEKEIDGIHFYLRRVVEDGKIFKHIKINHDKNTYLFHEEVQALMPFHFHQFANNNGFEIVNEFGNYDLDMFNPKTSDRYILVLKKKG